MTPREFENEPASAAPVRLTQFSAANSTGPGLQPLVPAGSAGARCSPSLATAAAAVTAAAAAVSSFISFTAPSLSKEWLSTQPAAAAAGPPNARASKWHSIGGTANGCGLEACKRDSNGELPLV